MRFPNLEQLAHRCANNTKDSVSITAQQARGISNEYMHMLETITKLQAQLIDAQSAISVQLDTGEF